ncbi:MAG: helicase C-terminal domain-containing protein [Spirochaetales bacterium]|uniref:DNA 5'-3' helicase n=1 Tax=Candidatus Thalassospirochaeta sargassi TaxID=3119039 RepID=A0AAJ1MIU3_9SPIO|nr:helicase C-terminal domain-containing protein [Spirochaetales bacterium]
MNNDPMNAVEKLSTEVINKLREAILDADGNEVMAWGKVCEGVINELTVAARGDEGSVPAIFQHMEKGDVVIHNHPGGILKPSGADMQIAGRLGEHGIGFYIVDSDVERVYAVVEPVTVKERRALDVDELAALIEPDGALESAMKDGGFYEFRPSQVAMLRRVADSFNEGRICVAEAGTGVGKSMAYLLPALNWAAMNDERVVVSTATINLQHQLVDKDIPLAKKILGSVDSAFEDCRTVLVKGRGNYVCLRRLSNAVEEQSLFDEENDDLESIKKWSETTKIGTRDDISFYPSTALWSKVNSEGDSCLGLRCKYREKCFVLKSKKEAASAQLLVVNHHLLFSDLAMRLEGAGFDNSVVLPPFTRIIFDEAHNMESSATSFFSSELNLFSVFKQVNRLYSKRRARTFGAVVNLQLEAGAFEEDEKIPGLIDGIKEQMQVLDTAAVEVMSNEFNIRLRRDTEEIFKDAIFPAMLELQKRILDCVHAVENIVRRLDENDMELPVVFEVRMLERRLEAFASVCQSFTLWEEKPGDVFWVERSKSSSGEYFARFVITPLDISQMMRESVFSPYETVVCTSATISVNRDFRFWSARVGLNGFEDREVAASMFKSPFPYKDRVLLGLPEDAPEPNTSEYQSFVEDFTLKLLELSEGRGLILFTSYRMLTETFDVLKPGLDKLGITALKQGDDERTRLLERFKTDTASVLFATSSFWEGIDSPGDTLKVVIICKLPFMVPTDPVIAARMEAVEARGGNQFMEYMLPEAVIRLKQGFGRLMRRGTDSGVVAILDSRMLKKYYGRIFVNSLPETARSFKPSEGILRDCEHYLFRS